MRPGEIDFSSRAVHFFDLSNGEVLAGENDLNEYLAQGANLETIRNIGSLLRQMEDGLAAHLYDPVDYSTWTPERFREYGKWIEALVEPPKSPQHKRLTGEVFDNALRIGLGPGRIKLHRQFGSLSDFYLAIEAQDVKLCGLFDDWDIDLFIQHVRGVGGDRRPTVADINAVSEESPFSPSADIISERFKKIGGFNKIVELAGYPVISLWEREDYIDWGVRFMKANDGILPTASMVDYLSSKKRGPSASIVRKKFVQHSAFQAEIEKEYIAAEDERKQDEEELLTEIGNRLRRDLLPAELFIEEDEAITDMKPLQAGELSSVVNVERILELYAKYIVIDDLLPTSSVDNKVRACQEAATSKAFVAACKKHNPISAADIEYSATSLGVFDLIWPLSYYYENLKIDDEFEAAMKARSIKNAESWQRRKQNKVLVT